MLVPCLRRWLLRKTSLATFTWMLPESTPRAPPQQPRHGPWASAVGPTLLLSTDLATGVRVSSPCPAPAVAVAAGPYQVAALLGQLKGPS